MPDIKYSVIVDFGTPTYGYWDGPVTIAHFSPEGHHPSKGHYVKFGSISVNHWFTVKAGRSWKEAASAAKKHLVKTIRIPAKITVEESE
jgi:hypothetical protein